MYEVKRESSAGWRTVEADSTADISVSFKSLVNFDPWSTEWSEIKKSFTLIPAVMSVSRWRPELVFMLLMSRNPVWHLSCISIPPAASSSSSSSSSADWSMSISSRSGTLVISLIWFCGQMQRVHEDPDVTHQHRKFRSKGLISTTSSSFYYQSGLTVWSSYWTFGCIFRIKNKVKVSQVKQAPSYVHIRRLLHPLTRSSFKETNVNRYQLFAEWAPDITEHSPWQQSFSRPSAEIHKAHWRQINGSRKSCDLKLIPEIPVNLVSLEDLTPASDLQPRCDPRITAAPPAAVKVLVLYLISLMWIFAGFLPSSEISL